MQDPGSPTRDKTCTPLQWKCGVPTTGLSGKSSRYIFKFRINFINKPNMRGKREKDYTFYFSKIKEVKKLSMSGKNTNTHLILKILYSSFPV